MFKISLAAARVNAGLSQREAAKALDVCPETISNWETGKYDINIADFVRLCELYKAPQDAINLPR